jgi:lipoate-protein ligase A
VRRLTVHDCRNEDPREVFSRDHDAICGVARDGSGAILRVRRTATEAVSLGRFHRRPAGEAPLFRRLTGGRAVAIGPGILSLTGVFPSVAWLALGRELPGPDQILNRALRPLLASLRAGGVDAFYGGRDLITSDGAPISVASFTVLPDGIVVLEAYVAVSTSFERCAAMLAEWDPHGLVLHDASVFATAPSLEQRTGAAAGGLDWAALIAEQAEAAYACEASLVRPAAAPMPQPATGPAFAAFQGERGAIPAGWATAVAIEMLGAVEAAALIEGGRIATLELSGDLISSYASITEIEDACVGQPPSRAAAERALLSVLSRPGRFVLGARDLAGLIARVS